ncbi:MAG: glycoside hydrolase family 140 protein [Opitutaceae bacterium]|nr:glycoside hydrolase family 140 protein [Opitutaceae bacterium]
MPGAGGPPLSPFSVSLPSLKIRPGSRFFESSSGGPVLLLGDTAWELFHRADRSEVSVYLRNRSEKQFNLVLACLVPELDGVHTPNRLGQRPFLNGEPLTPDRDYFDFVRSCVAEAAALGLRFGLLPTWGDKVNNDWGIGPRIFNEDNARAYGLFLGRNFSEFAPIWVLGGDRNPRAQDIPIWNAMAAGLREGSADTALITYHPNGKFSSSQWFHDAPWLSFNSLQSSHYEKHYPNHQMIEADWLREPRKPVLDLEPCYEDHVVRVWDLEYGPLSPDHPYPDSLLYPLAKDGIFDECDVRQAAYWSVLAGAAGFVYGHNSIWMMWQPGIMPAAPVRRDWKSALDAPGANNMTLFRRFFERGGFQGLVPDQSLLLTGRERGHDHVRAARTNDNTCILAYIPQGRPETLLLDSLVGDRHSSRWFNPKTGDVVSGETWNRMRERRFVPPRKGRSWDWVLILEPAGTTVWTT